MIGTTGVSSTDKLDIYEVAVIVEVTGIDVSKEIYTPFKGRIYGATWGARKTAADMINDPVDMIEHCKRLQDWTEVDATEEPGKAYAAGALILLDGSEDSYNSTGTLADVRAYRPAFQVFDTAKAYTDALVKRLCRTYDVTTRIDQDGYECINTLALQAPAETITFADIRRNSMGPESKSSMVTPISASRFSMAASRLLTASARIFS
jgi:hypothetical protein